MFAITGITGNVGGEVARALLDAKQQVRAVLRNPTKGTPWKNHGCETAIADIQDPTALATALAGAEAVFLLVPPNFDPNPGFPEAHAIAANLRLALEKARPDRVVYLSTIGAQAKQENLLSQHTIIEAELRNLPIPITFLRPGWFMENSIWDIAPARERGIIPSFLQPLDKPVPMVATVDIGRLAAKLLQERWTGHRIIELEGPHRVTPNEVAEILSDLLHQPVTMQVVPRDKWEALFRQQGMKNPQPRIQMLDGFNEGWIDFEAGPAKSLKGDTEIETVLSKLLLHETKFV